MDLTQGINAVMLFFLAVGGVDYLLDGRFGLGKEFEEGIVTCGRLLFVMAGFMVLAPLIARELGPVVSPLTRTLGLDPSILAGMLLANDAGGLPLALELAESQDAGLFSGLLVLLLLLKERIVPVFSIFGKLMSAISVFGLLYGAAESLLGITIFPGMNALEEVFPVVGNIAVFLGGAFTLVAVVRRVFTAGLSRACRLLRINDSSVSTLILSLANSLASILMIHEMDGRGRLLNIAFLTSAGCALGDHLAYTNQIAPELCVPVMMGKLVGGASALAVALLLAKRLPPL